MCVCCCLYGGGESFLSALDVLLIYMVKNRNASSDLSRGCLMISSVLSNKVMMNLIGSFRPLLFRWLFRGETSELLK